MKTIIIAAALGTLGLAGIAAAAPIVNVRQANQERRIDAGTRSGKLTHAEAARLKSEQRAIALQQKRLRARHGGHLTARDKRTIHARQEAANGHILKQKGNARRGPNKLKI